MRKRVSSKQKKILVWLIVSVAIAACVAGFICFKQTHTIDLNQYLTIGYEGYNGYAEPVVILDAKALERDYGGRMQDPPESLWKESDAIEWLPSARGIRMCLMAATCTPMEM